MAGHSNGLILNTEKPDKMHQEGKYGLSNS